MLPARTLALFASDLHLQPSHPHTRAAFFAFLEERAMASEALYLLGDLFEYWAGDDDLADPFHATIIAGMREGSRAAHGTKTYEIMDVTPQAVADLFAATDSDIIIHGHTHRPALHENGAKRRLVLPDWEPDADPARGGWIAITADGAITRHDLDGKPL
jgi:UDP-2,3-diacylglucosamine pyrophosphatase LpxH